jgi:integrase
MAYHPTAEPHDCDDRCKLHTCKGLSDGTLRKIYAILTGAPASAPSAGAGSG